MAKSFPRYEIVKKTYPSHDSDDLRATYGNGEYDAGDCHESYDKKGIYTYIWPAQTDEIEQGHRKPYR